MAEKSNKPYGGVIAAPDRPAEAIVALLSHHIRDRFDLVYYPHAKEIPPERHHHFMVVFSVGDLDVVVRRYRGNGHATPVIIHVDEPDMLKHIDYKAFFPDFEVIPIEQADLTAQPDITLRLDLFRRVIEALEARVRVSGASSR